MDKKYTLGIIGCGDFLRTQTGQLKDSKLISVRALFDPIRERAENFAKTLGGKAVGSADAVLNDPDVDIVGIFVPPWLRKDLLLAAIKNKKQILATKPFVSTIADCAEILDAFDTNNSTGGAPGHESKINCGVIYSRAGSALVETYKKIFESGEVGKLILYKQDWLHHYPQWNDWATDPARNGGPFMDAMVHNMNIAEYLMGRPAVKCAFFSDRHAHPDMACADTEFMKLDFAGGGSAHLFITWAADLEVYNTDGNYREHIDIKYMVTDKGWRLTDGVADGIHAVTASREGKTLKWPVERMEKSLFDRFALFLSGDAPWPSDISGVRESVKDIQIIRTAYENNGIPFTIE